MMPERKASRADGGTVQEALGAVQLLAINNEFQTAQPRHLAPNSLSDLRGVLRGGVTSQDLGLYIATVCTVHAVAAEPDSCQWHEGVLAGVPGIAAGTAPDLRHRAWLRRRDALRTAV